MREYSTKELQDKLDRLSEIKKDLVRQSREVRSLFNEIKKMEEISEKEPAANKRQRRSGGMVIHSTTPTYDSFNYTIKKNTEPKRMMQDPEEFVWDREILNSDKINQNECIKNTCNNENSRLTTNAPKQRKYFVINKYGIDNIKALGFKLIEKLDTNVFVYDINGEERVYTVYSNEEYKKFDYHNIRDTQEIEEVEAGVRYITKYHLNNFKHLGYDILCFSTTGKLYLINIDGKHILHSVIEDSMYEYWRNEKSLENKKQHSNYIHSY